MKTISKFLSLVLILTLSSCLVDDDVRTDSYDDGPNILTFSRTSLTANATTDGNIVSVPISIELVGPTSLAIDQDVPVSVSVDPSSTAVAGTHYMLENTSTVLSPDNNLTGSIMLSIITEGIVAPLAETPILKLNIDPVSESDLVVSGRSGEMEIAINYLCYSNMAGDYTNPSAPTCNQSNPITVTEDSPGRYYVSSMTGYRWQSLDCIGYYIIDSCGSLSYDGGDLEDNGYSGEGGTGMVNEDGSFTFTCKLNEVGYSEESTYTPL